jgi:hypothetical protein
MCDLDLSCGTLPAGALTRVRAVVVDESRWTERCAFSWNYDGGETHFGPSATSLIPKSFVHCPRMLQEMGTAQVDLVVAARKDLT